MIELVAAAVVVGYLLLGVAARLFLPMNTDLDDITQDETISLFVWLGATIVAGIGMVLVGESPLHVALAALGVVVVGGVAYAVLFYDVWGAHIISMLSIGNNRSWVGYVWSEWIVFLGFPVILPASLLILATRGVDSLDTGTVVRILATIGAVALVVVLVLRSTRRT